MPRRKSGSSSYNYDPEYDPYRRLKSIPSPSPSPNHTTSHRQQDGAPASSTHHDTGNSYFEIATGKEIGTSFVDPSLALIHHSIINKYGDIGRECPLVDPKIRAYILERICKVVQELEGKTLDNLDENHLSTYDLSLRDAELVNFNVKWLRQRLDELRDGVKSFVESKQATKEKIKVMNGIDGRKKDLEILKDNEKKLKLKREEREGELAVKTSDAERLSCKINGLKTRYQRFESKSLIYGLL